MKKLLYFFVLIGTVLNLLIFINTVYFHSSIQSNSSQSIPEETKKPPEPPKPQPGSKVEWIKFEKQRDQKAASAFLTDIINHLPKEMGNQYYFDDPSTWGHETTHGINSYIRNNLAKRDGVGFYVGDDKAVVLTQPKLTLKQISEIIPQNLRGSRYNLYFVQQLSGWNDTPLYCFDEWVAYTNGAKVAIETPPNTESGVVGTDSVSGTMEFSIYALCACLAIDKHDPEYLKTNTQFKEFVAHELKRSAEIYNAGMKIPFYKWDTPLLKNVAGNEDIKNILKKMYGDSLTLDIFKE